MSQTAHRILTLAALVAAGLSVAGPVRADDPPAPVVPAVAAPVDLQNAVCPVKGKPVRLEDLAATGDTATGKLTNGTSETWKVALKAVDGNWQFVLPEEQYQPSGWNDGFLFGYLDAIHAWRF